MEILCKSVKENVCLDYTDEVFIDIKRAVDTFMSRLIRNLHEDGERVEIDRLIPCGSIEEKTKLLLKEYNQNSGLEFDYLAVIKRWPDIGDIQYEQTCPGSMEIKYTVTDPESDSKEMDILTNQAGDIFRSKLLRAVEKRCDKNWCERFTKMDTSSRLSKGCSACTIYLSHGHLKLQSISKNYFSHLEFVWTPKPGAQKIEKTSVFGPDFVDLTDGKCKVLTNPLVGDFNTILVDIHPVFELDVSKIVNIDNEIKMSNHEMLHLFPKCMEHHRMFSECPSWRISTSEKELVLIKMVSNDHRLAYTTLKFLTVTIFNCMRIVGLSNWDISPYMIKTVFLHHISKCNEIGKDTEQCVFDMLLDLSEYFFNQHISHFCLKFNLHMSHQDIIFTRCVCFTFRSLAGLLRKPSLQKCMADIFIDCISFCFIYLITRHKCEVEDRQRLFGNTKTRKTREEQYRYMTSNIEKNFESFVHSREINSAENALKVIIEMDDFKLLKQLPHYSGHYYLRNSNFGIKLLKWLEHTEGRELGVYIL